MRVSELKSIYKIQTEFYKSLYSAAAERIFQSSFISLTDK